ncbi:MAG: SDR family oxidoreductase [Pseudomonadota bacterium]
MFQTDLLKGKRIFVTGGGTGLGREMVEQYLRLGADIIICGRRGSVLEATAKELMGQFGGNVSTKVLDIKDPEAVDRVVKEIFEEGDLHGLVNNAAGNFVSPTKDLSHRGFDAIANIVFHGTFYVTHAVGKNWIERGQKGSIISILVTWVWTGSPFVVPSAMSKAGLHVMTKSLANEWGRYGIRLNAIAPGPFPTEGAMDRLHPGQKAWAEQQVKTIPMGRPGEMHELSNLATFLMADGCEYLTGQTIAIDGARMLTGGDTFSSLSGLSDDDWQQMKAMIQATNAKDKAERG